MQKSGVFNVGETTPADWSVFGVLSLSVLISVLRILALVVNYGAPVEAFAFISSQVSTGKAPPTTLQQDA